MEEVKISGFEIKIKICITSIAWCLKGERRYIENSTSAMNYAKLLVINLKTFNGILR